MGRSISILTIVGAAFAFLAALVFSADASFLLSIVALVATVFLFLQKDLPGWILGGASLVFSVVGALGVIGNVSTETGEVQFGISVNMGRALLIAAMTLPTAHIVWAKWGQQEAWIGYVGAGAVALTAMLAFAMAGSLGDQTGGGAFAVAFASLLLAVPGVMAMRG